MESDSISNQFHFMLCEHCSLFKTEKLEVVSTFFNCIESEDAKNLAKFFKSMFDENVAFLAQVHNALETKNKEAASKFLLDFVQKDKKRLDNIIQAVEECEEESNETSKFVRRFVEGSFKKFSQACRQNGSYNLRDIDLKSMCAARLKKQTSMQNGSFNPTNGCNNEHREASSDIQAKKNEFVDTPSTEKSTPSPKIANKSSKNSIRSDSNAKFSAKVDKPAQEASPVSTNSQKTKTKATMHKSDFVENGKNSEVNIAKRPRQSLPAQSTKETLKRVRIVEPNEDEDESEENNAKTSKKKARRKSTNSIGKSVNLEEAAPNKKGRGRPKKINSSIVASVITEPQTSTLVETSEAARNDSSESQNIDWSEGDFVSAYDSKSAAWYTSKILKIYKNKFLIHFHNWSKKFDTWFERKDLRQLKTEEMPKPRKNRATSEEKKDEEMSHVSTITEVPVVQEVSKILEEKRTGAESENIQSQSLNGDEISKENSEIHEASNNDLTEKEVDETKEKEDDANAEEIINLKAIPECLDEIDMEYSNDLIF